MVEGADAVPSVTKFFREVKEFGVEVAIWPILNRGVPREVKEVSPGLLLYHPAVVSLVKETAGAVAVPSSL